MCNLCFFVAIHLQLSQNSTEQLKMKSTTENNIAHPVWHNESTLPDIKLA